MVYLSIWDEGLANVLDDLLESAYNKRTPTWARKQRLFLTETGFPMGRWLLISGLVVGPCWVLYALVFAVRATVASYRHPTDAGSATSDWSETASAVGWSPLRDRVAEYPIPARWLLGAVIVVMLLGWTFFLGLMSALGHTLEFLGRLAGRVVPHRNSPSVADRQAARRQRLR